MPMQIKIQLSKSYVNNSGFNRLYLGVMATAILIIPAYTAQATAPNLGDDNVSLKKDHNPVYDPHGLGVDSFTLFPSVTAGTKYNDNIFATENNESSDFVSYITPSLIMRSDFVRHQLNFGAFAEIGKYHDFSSENYEDYGGVIDGRLDITGNTIMPVKLGFSHLHEDRERPDNLNNAAPLTYDLAHASAGLVRNGQKITHKLYADLKKRSYDDSKSATGATIDQRARNRDTYQLYGSIGITPEAILAPYAYSELLEIDYTDAAPANNRSASELEFGVGTNIHVSDITQISVNIGHKNRSFDNNVFNDIDTITYGSNLSWEPLEELAILAEADRTIAESFLNGASSSINSAVRLSSNYKAKDNIILQPSLTYLHRDYKGAIPGKLNTTNAGMNVLYKVNPNLWADTSYQYTTQSDNETALPLNSFQRSVVNVSLKAQF